MALVFAACGVAWCLTACWLASLARYLASGWHDDPSAAARFQSVIAFESSFRWGGAGEQEPEAARAGADSGGAGAR